MAEYELLMVARAVKKGDGFTEAAKDVDQLNKKVKESGQGAENFGKKLNGVLDGVTKGFAAVTGAAVTFKKAFDYSREGAELNQLTDSFELLNKNVLQTPDLLDDMRRAAGGTIKDTDLMGGVLKLAAGATGEYAQTLANISPQLLEIARASNKLNPSLGDTAFLYESLTTAAKRQSVPIADNLGLIIKMDDAVKQVHPSLQSLASSYDQLTDQQKFLNELLFQGGNLIDQVGGDVNSAADSWARLEVNVVTLTDSWKRMLAEGLNPVVSALAGDYDQAVRTADGAGQAQVKTLEDLETRLVRVKESYDLSRSVLGMFTNTQDATRDALHSALLELADNTDSYEDFAKKADEAGVSITDIRNIVLAFNPELQGNIGLWRTYAVALQEAADADQLFANYIKPTVPAIERTSDAADDLADKYGQMANAQGDAIRVGEKYYQNHIASTEALEAQTKAIEESIARKEENARVTAELAAAEGDYFTAAIQGNSELYDALLNTGKQTAFVSNLTGAQADDLARMQTAYDKATQTIRDYELGVKGANLTDDARNKKMEEQQAIMATLTANMQPLIDAGGQYVTTTEDANAQTDALNRLLYEAADAADADARTLAGLMSITGDYTKEQINAALQTAATTAKAQELAQQLADGTITVGEARDALADFAQEWTASASITVEEDKFRGLLRSLIEFDGRTFRATAAVDTQGSVPSSGGGSGKGGEKGGEADYDPNKKHAAGTGGWLTVPPGFPNDTYTIGLTSGEKYAAIPSGVGMASALGGGGTAMTTMYQINVDARGASDPTAVYQAGYAGARRAMLESGARADQIRRTM